MSETATPFRKDLLAGVAGKGLHQHRRLLAGQSGAQDRCAAFDPLGRFAPLARLPGVRLISLQKTHGLDQLRELPGGMQVVVPGDGFDDGPDAFLDTAALMQGLDLVVTSDTAIAHLAGALGRPVWVGLQWMPEWRWVLERTDNPWYPTMHLFRQPTRGDWNGVFDAMAAALRHGAPCKAVRTSH